MRQIAIVVLLSCLKGLIEDFIGNLSLILFVDLGLDLGGEFLGALSVDAFLAFFLVNGFPKCSHLRIDLGFKLSEILSSHLLDHGQDELLVLDGVLVENRRRHRVWFQLVSELGAVAHVHIRLLAILVKGESTWPHKRPDHDNSMANCLALFSLVLGLVANETHHPRCLHHLAAHFDLLIARDRLQTRLKWVSILNLFLGDFNIVFTLETFRSFFGWVKMERAAVVQNGCVHVNPGTKLGRFLR